MIIAQKMYPPPWCQDENLMVECYMNYENIETIYDSCFFKAQEDASDISSRERGRFWFVYLEKLGDISVGSWKVFKEGTKHPAPKLKHTGALKMHSHRICFCSVSKSLCDFGQVITTWILASQRPGLEKGSCLLKIL